MYNSVSECIRYKCDSIVRLFILNVRFCLIECLNERDTRTLPFRRQAILSSRPLQRRQAIVAIRPRYV